ncbi:GILT-like protein F37H8.5 [Trichinella nativa]|uniref:GILT-like protein F37H8.5 n=1 Tax=Trichinella nativa TaxID=6335 RepID=A0A0V1KL43_9BILA|nr:GILT-like protein F37H8.5 [Trichinella nativa]
MAEITENVKPHPHYFVPWILINDLSTAQLQIYQNGLFNFLCDWHRGSVPKGCAEFTNLFKQRKNMQNRRGSVRSRCSSTICQTFARRANESGLYDVGSSWPTEYRVVQKTVVGMHSVDSSEQRVNIEQDEITVREIDGYSNDNEARVGGPGGWLVRTANEQLAHSGSFDLAMVVWRARPSGGFFIPPHRVSLTPPGAARRRDSDLADGMRVLSSSYPRLSATSPGPGHTD